MPISKKALDIDPWKPSNDIFGRWIQRSLRFKIIFQASGEMTKDKIQGIY
jgi:hypothetical protein